MSYYLRSRVVVDFAHLPYQIQSAIMEKFTYELAGIFEECCSFSHLMCSRHPLLYPLSAENLKIEEDHVCFKKHAKDKIWKSAFKLKEKRKVLFRATTVSVAGPVNKDQLTFIKLSVANVGDVRFLRTEAIDKGSNEEFILKTFKPKTVVLDVSQMEPGAVHNYAHMEDLHILNAYSFSAAQIFTITAGRATVINGVSFTTKEIIDQIELWRKNHVKFVTKTIVLAEIMHFQLDLFIEAMMQETNFRYVSDNVWLVQSEPVLDTIKTLRIACFHTGVIVLRTD